MPLLGPEAPVVGYLGFCSVKLAGYTAAAHVMGRTYIFPERNILAVGFARTLLGMAFGAAYFFIFAKGGSSPPFILFYMAGLIPVRIIEWWIIVLLFYDRDANRLLLDWKVVCIATIWSFVVDLPATLGWCITGGVSVC